MIPPSEHFFGLKFSTWHLYGRDKKIKYMEEGKKGQDVVSMTSGANPIRADAKHKYPDLDLKSKGYKLLVSSLTTDYYTEFDKEFRGLFMKRLRR